MLSIWPLQDGSLQGLFFLLKVQELKGISTPYQLTSNIPTFLNPNLHS
jgi:hypothetical protein